MAEKLNFFFYGIFSPEFFKGQEEKALDNVRVDIEKALKPGEKVKVTYKPASAHDFYAGSGILKGTVPMKRVNTPGTLYEIEVEKGDKKEIFKRIEEQFDAVEHAYLKAEVPISENPRILKKGRAYDIKGKAIIYLGFNETSGVSEGLEKDWLKDIAESAEIPVDLDSPNLDDKIKIFLKEKEGFKGDIVHSELVKGALPKVYAKRGFDSGKGLKEGQTSVLLGEERMPYIDLEEKPSGEFVVEK